jgi:hypothetical protein
VSRPRVLSPRRLAALVGCAALLCSGPALAQQPPPDEEEIPAAPKAPPSPPPPAAPPPAAPPPAAPPSSAAPASAELETLKRELREQRAALAARLDALEAEAAARRSSAPPSASPPPAKPEAPGEPAIGGSLPGRGAWTFGSYVQAQYEQHQNSSDQLAPGGAYLNQDRFLVRRGRLRFEAAWEYVELAAELDGNTVGAPVFGPRRLNASLVWRGRPWEGRIDPRTAREWDPPLARLTLGLTGIPFGFELADSPKDRVFLERSRASSAFFPGEQDVGVVLAGGAGFFRYSVAAMNGEPLGDTSALPVGDPTHAKDLSARLGADVRASEGLRIAGGVSALYGTGFHAGTDATKGGVTWVDLNQNGQIDPGELTGIPPMAATPSQNFTRWAVGADLQIRLRTPIGWSMLYGEVTLATNLDRGLFVADPVTTGVDVRELGAYAAFVQEVTRYGLVGFRFDYYDPNADFFQSTAGKLVPVSQAISTFAPVVGLQIPDRARLIFEYDAVKNLLGLDTRGVPTNLPMNWFAVRLQVQL